MSKQKRVQKSRGTPPAKPKKKPTRMSIHLYLPPEERDVWDRALALSGRYDTFASMARDLVQRYYKQLLKKAADDCPE